MPTTFRVPEGMSCVNAFYALWVKSNSDRFMTIENSQDTTSLTAEKVADLFKTRRNLNFDSEGGRAIKTAFINFPEINAYLYDLALNRQGAAYEAIQEYSKIPPSERFDKNDSYQFKELRKHTEANAKIENGNRGRV